MNGIVNIPVKDVVPSDKMILAAQGITDPSAVGSSIRRLAVQAGELFGKLARPIGMAIDIDSQSFDRIFHSSGQNIYPSPIEDVYRRSSSLALFALTMGSTVSDRISALFRDGEFALGNMLDAAASEGAEAASVWISRQVRDHLIETERIGADAEVLGYSPGYCGWHVSGQRPLFDTLHPEKIGITLRESCLMEPLKSISGVIIAGHYSIHLFDDSYPTCSDCPSRPCRTRVKNLRKKYE